MPISTFEPSRGGSGSMLNTASQMLSWTDTCKNIQVARKAPGGTMFRMNGARRASAKASAMLDNGPASATHIMSRRGFLNRAGFTMTGLAQPKEKKNSISVPTGSRWARGFSVRRPSNLGPGSPRRTAAAAWAYSWMARAKSTAATRKINTSSLKSEIIMLRFPPRRSRRLLRFRAPAGRAAARRGGQPRRHHVARDQVGVRLAADHQLVPALMDQHHGRPRDAVVVAGHGEIVRPRVKDRQHVARLGFGPVQLLDEHVAGLAVLPRDGHRPGRRRRAQLVG